MRRVLAIIGLVFFIGCLLATLICALAGAPKNVILALLFCDIVVPCIVYGYIKITEWIRKD